MSGKVLKVIVRELGDRKTAKVLREFDVSDKSERYIERLTMGLLRNMDVDKYCVDEILEEPPNKPHPLTVPLAMVEDRTPAQLAADGDAPKRDEWLCGYAAALAAAKRLHDDTSVVESVLVSDGITLARLKDAGVEEFDLCQIRKCVRARDPKKWPVRVRKTNYSSKKKAGK